MVVTSAQFMFDSESKLREAIQKMLEPKKSEPTAEEVRESPDESMGDLFDGQSDKKDAGKKDEDLEQLF